MITHILSAMKTDDNGNIQIDLAFNAPESHAQDIFQAMLEAGYGCRWKHHPNDEQPPIYELADEKQD